jgi:hypothetical protein
VNHKLLHPREDDDRTAKEPRNYSTADEFDAEQIPIERNEAVVSLRSRSNKTKREIPGDQTNVTNEMPDTPSRLEVAAQLQAAEARTETRIAQLTATIEARASSADHKSDLLTAKIDALSTSITGQMGAFAEAVKEVKAETKSTRSSIWIVGIGSVLAVLASIVALWVAGLAIQNNMIAIFQAGLGTRTMPPIVSAPTVDRPSPMPPKPPTEK